ncbi:MAG TPA: aminoglycoside phosphotransferase family protein [Caulobacteraceae bacterium]
MDELAGLLARIRSEFPRLAFKDAALIDDGADHRVALLDDRWLFRFPRARPGEDRLSLFRAELALLARLEGVSAIPVPRYRFISKAREFGGYRKIEGTPMRPGVFAGLRPEVRASIVEAVANLLRLIHALPVSTIAQSGGAIAREWTGEDWRRRWIRERRAVVAKVVDAALLERMDRFYDQLAAAKPPPRELLIHGDVTDDHLLLAAGGERLAGLIDFGDACVGDPAYDLAYFFAYGEDTARHLVARYDPPGADRTILDRARRQFTRYCIDQLWWGAMGSVAVDTETVVAELVRLLAAEPKPTPRPDPSRRWVGP